MRRQQAVLQLVTTRLGNLALQRPCRLGYEDGNANREVALLWRAEYPLTALRQTRHRLAGIFV